MHITKSKLKHIIKEEVRNALREQLHPEHAEEIARRKRRQKQKVTAGTALNNFFRSLSKMRHEAYSGKWLQDAIKSAKRSFKKGDYEEAVQGALRTAIVEKAPKIEILQNALEAIKSIGVPKASIDAAASFGSLGGRKL